MGPGMVDRAKFLVALPGEGDFVAGVPGGEFRIHPGRLFVGEMFGADLQGPAEAVKRVAPCVPGAHGVVLDTPADLIDQGRAQLHNMEGVQDGDGLGQFMTDRVRVAPERIQRGRLDPGGEIRSSLREPAGVGLPGSPRNKVQQAGIGRCLSRRGCGPRFRSPYRFPAGRYGTRHARPPRSHSHP